jgi:hypothetical protein
VATLQQLQSDVLSWINRRDCAGLLPAWTAMLETEIAATCRTRAQVVSGVQDLDAAYITLPTDFAAMESIRDNSTGEMFELKDQWSPKGGGWTENYRWPGGVIMQTDPTAPVRAYRLVADCIEWIPHPIIPDPPDPTWVPQQVLMGYYQKPRPLLLPTDTNPILERYYSIYLYGLVKIAALWALDDARAQQVDALWQQEVTRANLWKQQSDYSGAPLRAELVRL